MTQTAGIHATHRRLWAILWAMLFLLLAESAQAAWFKREAPRPGKTTMEDSQVEIPAQIISRYVIITTKWDRRGPYNFLIDTGATITLVSPALAQRYGVPNRNPQTGKTEIVAVRSASGEMTTLESTTLQRLELPDVSFERVPALVYDCNDISVHLGVKIDGILGFPLFREVLLTLDYPRNRILLSKPNSASALFPGTSLPIPPDSKAPIISLATGNQSFLALIDTGSDCTLRLNPLGLGLPYDEAPRPGAIITTLTGDRRQTVARLGTDLQLGSYALERPVVELTDELSAIGGSILSQFTVTFDQERSQVTFFRDQHGALRFPAKRSSGISVAKAGAYWRIVGVIPDSPAAKAGIESGDLITRINDEPVEFWNLERYTQLIEHSDTITFAFLVGRREYEMKLAVMNLVP